MVCGQYTWENILEIKQGYVIAKKKKKEKEKKSHYLCAMVKLSQCL